MMFFLFFFKYGSCVWDPQDRNLREEIEKVQDTAARFVTSNYCFETGSMTGILETTKLRVSQVKRRDSILYIFVQRSKRCCQRSNRRPNYSN